MLKKVVFHPALLAAFPVLFLFAVNANEIRLNDLWLPLLMATGLTLVVQLAFSMLPGSAHRVGLLLTIFIFLFFSYGHLPEVARLVGVDMGSFVTLRNKAALAAMGALFLLLAYFMIRSGRTFKNWTFPLNVVALLLVSIQLLSAGFVIVNRSGAVTVENNSTALPTDTDNLSRPDIYYIIVDGFGRSDILDELYDYDNSEFIAQLRQAGFYVADSSFSNYAQTLQSLPSTLNLDWIQNLTRFGPEHKDRVPLEIIFQGNQVLKKLRGHGYKIACFASGYSGTEFNDVDYFYSRERDASEFASLVFRTTPLPLLTGRSLHDDARDRIKYAFDKLPSLNETEKPLFAFAHIISPHPPFMFDENGNDSEPDRVYYRGDGHHFLDRGGTQAEYLTGYKKQARAIANMAITCVKQIIANSEKPPVIILQADHGPGSKLRWDSSERTYMKERFAVLNAYYMPGIDSAALYAAISPINSFRVLFNNYFGDSYEYLPDSSFFSVWKFPYQFENVTERLSEPLQPHQIPQSPVK